MAKRNGNDDTAARAPRPLAVVQAERARVHEAKREHDDAQRAAATFEQRERELAAEEEAARRAADELVKRTRDELAEFEATREALLVELLQPIVDLRPRLADLEAVGHACNALRDRIKAAGAQAPPPARLRLDLGDTRGEDVQQLSVLTGLFGIFADGRQRIA